MPQDILCADCAALDWRDFARYSTDPDFSKERSPHNDPDAPLVSFVRMIRTPHKQLKTSACRICRILSIIKDAQCDQEWESGGVHDRHLVVGPFLSQIQLSPSRDNRYNPALLWIGGRLDFGVALGHRYGKEPKYIALFQPGFWAESCKIQPLITDFRWMQDAIADCYEHHSNCSQVAPTTSVHGLLVIDCLARCSTLSIILAPGLCRYVALSYVWGPAHVAGDEVAATIKDAMKVTLQLGLRYLWVDRYCIPQDGEEKHRFIHVMDEIYSNAYLTLIGAAGTTARDGLPGVSDVSRVVQVEVEADGCTFLEILRAPDAIRSSTWATRAWTYQEGLLSTRALVFTEKGVLYRCAARCIDESMQRLVPKGTNAYMREDFLPNLFRIDPRTCSKTNLRGQIQYYTQRQLTYPQDSLNAFLGVLRGYGRLDGRIEHTWGVPYREGTPELEWYHPGPAVRRPDFPSWSWAGWAGAVEWAARPIGTDSEVYSNPIFSPILVEVPVQSPSLSPPRWSFDRPKHIYVTGAVIPLRFCTPERTEHIRNMTKHLGHHPDTYSLQAHARGPYALFECFPGIFAAVRSFPDSEADFGDDVVGLLGTQSFGQKFMIANIFILKPVGNHFERVGFLNIEDAPYHESIHMDETGSLVGSLVGSDRLPWARVDIERPWLSKVERQRICIK